MLGETEDHSIQDNEGFSKGRRQGFKEFLSWLESNAVFAWVIIKATLTIALMALIVLSPALLWPLLMGWPEPYCYVAFAIWIAYFAVAFILASIIGYLREQRTS